MAPDDPATTPWTTGVVTHVVDGDTIDVDGFGRVRLIGIDTPESGDCGYMKATAVMTALVSGKTLTLTAVSTKDDVDQYGRLLR